MTDEGRNDFFTSEVRKFNIYHDRLKSFVYTDTEESKKDLNNLLDELNAIEYSLRLADEQVTGSIITQCCYLVPLKHDVLVTKVCHLTANLLSKQQMVINHGAETITEYLIEALQRCQGWTFCDILRALGVVLYENCNKLSKFHASLLGPNGYLLQLAQANEEDIVRGAMQCIENICIKVENQPYLSEEHYKACYQMLLRKLQTPKPQNMDPIIHARILISGLRGIHCIMLATKSLDAELLGPLLAALKVYMLYGLPGMSTVVPPSLNPTPMSRYDPSVKTDVPSKPSNSDKGATGGASHTEASKQPSKTQNKKVKKRRGKGKKSEKDEADDSEEKTAQNGMSRLSVSHDPSQHASAAGAPGESSSDTHSLFLPWNKQSSSESEFSDTEGGHSSKLRSLHCKIRQCAMGCFHAVIKAVEKKVMFGYWPAFIPDTPSAGGPTLFTAIMKDPSPKSRTGALAVLAALVDGSKQFLMAAEEADQYRNAPFTPFSVNLGHMVKEIHRCLMLSLVSETSKLATTQIIKCLATIMPNVPYHRLKPGLLSRIIKQIRPYISHRDPNIRVACLTAMGSMASVQAPMMEVLHILQSPHPPTKFSETSGLPQRFSDPLNPNAESQSSRKNSDSGYQSNNSGEPAAGGPHGNSPGIPTPNLSSGSQTPSMADQKMYGAAGEMSWIVKLCIRNVAAHLMDPNFRDKAAASATRPSESQGHVQPLPVRLESLQVLSILAKNYFPLLRPSLFILRDTIFYCLEDHDPVVQLHGAKLLEETAAVVLQQYQDDVPNKPDLNTMTEFWLQLLSGPLPNALQKVDYHAVKSTVCDCLSNIGQAIFVKLPLDKRILCITLMLGLCTDEGHLVRAAAVRALGVYVLYQCLREDVNFVADAANGIIKALSEQNLGVRVKAAWSLGNLSDALVLNRNEGDEGFMEDFSDMLLLKLFEVAIHASQDKDKVKSNAVRALGNLLRYLPERSLRSNWFGSIVDSAIQALVKNVTSGTMKVRWNACYATGNMFKNRQLPLGETSWSIAIYVALCSVIKECKNFKVRINAALAFSIPSARRCYGNTAQYAEIWQSLITALQSAESVTDFTEYRYRDNLTEQICGTLIHLSVLLEEDDLSIMSASVAAQRDLLHAYMDKYKQLLYDNDEQKGKVATMAHAKQHVETLMSNKKRSVQVQKFLELLREVYCMERKEPVYDDSQMTSPAQPPKSGFIQTYD